MGQKGISPIVSTVLVVFLVLLIGYVLFVFTMNKNVPIIPPVPPPPIICSSCFELFSLMVVDASGSPAIGYSVTLLEARAGQVFNSSTNSLGVAEFVGLPWGYYNVSIRGSSSCVSGFQSLSFTDPTVPEARLVISC